MTDAYVHAVVETSAIQQAAREIADSEAIEQVRLVTGEHDLVAQLDLETKDDIDRVVTEDIHSVNGIVETVTHVAFEP